MLKYVSRGAALLLLVAVLALPYVRSYLPGMSETFVPDVKADLVSKYVTVPSSDKPGEATVWQFDDSDKATFEQVDIYTDNRRKVVYVSANVATDTNYKLSGIMELQYIKAGNKYYLVALTSVNLKLTEPVEVEKKEPPAKSTINTAQPLPKSKQ